MTTRICLVRHGETDWNKQRRLQGHVDTPLNPNGLAQAKATAAQLRGLHFDALYTSDLQRARQTAEACAASLGIAAVDHPGLRERHFGVFQGLTYEEAQERHPRAYLHFKRRDPQYAFGEGSESLNDFFTRIQQTVTALADLHAGQQILLVAHGGVLDCVNRMVRNLPIDAERDFLIPNAALNWIARDRRKWQIITWAQQGHLEAAGDELPNA